MYRLLPFAAILAFLSISHAFECVPEVCEAGFHACINTGHEPQECQNWADETFHCCNECGTCNTAPKSKKDWECHPEFCDKVFDLCIRANPNSTDCLERADHASHCCYSCLDCPTRVSHKPLTPKSDMCDSNLCQTVFDVCHQLHPENSSLCWERADFATDCCYNCLDCPAKVMPSQPKYDHCLSDLCDNVFKKCSESEHSPDTCRKVANHASECCNMCNDCIPPESTSKPKYDHCLSNLCDNIFTMCTEKTNHHPDECREAANGASDCCNFCNDCH